MFMGWLEGEIEDGGGLISGWWRSFSIATVRGGGVFEGV